MPNFLGVEFRIITSFKETEFSNLIQPPVYDIENLSAVILNRNKNGKDKVIWNLCEYLNRTFRCWMFIGGSKGGTRDASPPPPRKILDLPLDTGPHC